MKSRVRIIACVAAAFFVRAAAAEQVVISGPALVEGRAAAPAQAVAANNRPDQPRAEKPKEEGKSKEDKKENEEAKKDGDKQPDSPPDKVTRSNEPPRTPDPRELEAKPDKDGRVPFNFHGQPWPDVLQWLANVSNLSLDWQELPGGYLNLTTQRSYSLPEARDLINRHLQSRGYTLLLSGEVLSVVKLESVDPSLIPRADEVDLYDRQPHDLVKVTFELPESIEVAKATEDFKNALSKTAKLIPLPSTRRILAIDTVANLRMVSQLLNQERLEADGREIPRRFVLKHARAEKVINTLFVVLGMDPAAQPSQMELQIQMQKMQLLQQMQQKGKDVQKLLSKDGPKVFLAFNPQENSILANAPPSEMKVIERTINFLDTAPPGSQRAESSDASDGRRFAKTYELENVQPDSLMLTLEEIGDLDPLTELRADRQAKLLFVRATSVDHDKVQGIIDQLDTGGLVFEVFQLRRHAADAVAGTVMALLGENKDDDKDNNRNYYSYWYGSRQQEETKKEPELRVDADIENNRLLVHGTADQITQVRDLLRKLGELDGGHDGAGPAMRVIETLDPSSSQQLLEQLRAAWPAIGGGAELIIEDPPEQEAEEPAATSAQDRSASSARPGRFHLLADEQPAADAKAETAKPEPKKPPVAVTVTPDGRIVLMSDDPAALARAEELLNTLQPREEQFHEFKIEHTDAYYIWYDLKDYFKDELNEDEDEGYRGFYYYYFGGGDDNKEPSPSLARRRKLQFLWITQTNSVIVANATPEQLGTIEKLIKVWDQPPRADDIRSRRTGMVKVKYSSPTIIASALKEVYRDLLSSRDKEFETEEDRGGSGYAAAKTTQVEFSGIDESGGPVSMTKPIKVRFDGALSIGVDEAAGMLLISAQTEIYDGVVSMIRLLDEEAKPTETIQVVRISAAAADEVQDALSDTFRDTWVGGRPERSYNQGGDQNRDRNRDRGDRRDRDRRRRDR